jgi:hypothetical protein
VSVERILETESKFEEKTFGDRRFIDKNQFTDDTPFEVVSKSGDRLGQGIGRSERTLFFQKLQGSVPTEVVPEEKFGEWLEKKSQQLEPDLLLVGNRMIVRRLRHVDEFVPGWRGDNHPYSDLPGYEGRMGSAPLCTVSEGRDSIIGFSFDDSVQVSRVQQNDGEILQVEIESIGEQKAKDMIEEDPQWTDDFESEDEAIRHLQQLVILDVSECITFEFGDGEIGFEIAIKEEASS